MRSIIFLPPCLLSVSLLGAASGDPVTRIPAPAVAIQDFTWDGTYYYFTTFLDSKIHRLDAHLKRVLPPLETGFNAGLGLTGIAYQPFTRTLWVIEPLSRELREVNLDGAPTGNVLAPPFLPVVNAMAEPLPRGMYFDPQGNGNRGTFWIAESVGSLIYEFTLDLDMVRALPHPDDRDGYPGTGLSAPNNDVQSIRDAAGALTGIYVTGGRQRTDWVRRLDPDGKYTGYSIPLAHAGGTTAGFAFVDSWDQGGNVTSPALIASVESSAEIVVLDGSEPPLGEIFDFSCAVNGSVVSLSWMRGSPYEKVNVYRDCKLLQVLTGDPSDTQDQVTSAGVYRYQLEGFSGELSVKSAECMVVIGAGRVLRQVEYPGQFPIDLAVDLEGRVYITDYLDQNIQVFDSLLQLENPIELPFLQDDDRVTGLAFNPAGLGSLFIYNTEKNVVYETDLIGQNPRQFPVALPNDEENPFDKAVVSAMSFDPLGGPGGAGALWLLELSRETIYSIDLDGNVLKSMPHPVTRQFPVPPASPIHNHMGGMSEVPALGFDFLDLTAGTALERDVERIIRMDTRTGAAVLGVEIPLAGQDQAVGSNFVGIQHAVKNGGGPVLYATAAAGSSSRLLELDPTIAQPPACTELSLRQRARDPAVAISFKAPVAYDRILIDRDCQPRLELKAGQFAVGAVQALDEDVPPGNHRYDVRAVLGAAETPVITGEIQVGPGATLDQEFSSPVLSPVQLSRDPRDGSLLVASNANGELRSLFWYNSDLTFKRAMEDVVPEPWEVATMAVRGRPGNVIEIYVLGWLRSTALGGQPDFTLLVLSESGVVQAEKEVSPPQPSNGFITYPAGLTWDPFEDVFYYLERNSDTIVRMDTEGKTLALIPHPDAPLQSFVFNLGMFVDPDNGALFATSAGPLDRRITRALQLTRGGRPTGIEIDLAGAGMDPLNGLVVDGSDLVIAGYSVGGELKRLQAFHPIAAPTELSCSARGSDVELSWQPAAAYDQVVVLRNGQEAAVLGGSARSYRDVPPNRNSYLIYSVLGRAGGRSGKNSFCEIPPLPAGFIRGDVDGSGAVDVTDPVVLLQYLFLSGAYPFCDDAADADDQGDLSITDAILILGRLFLGGDALPLPYPDPGQDPTADGLSCS